MRGRKPVPIVLRMLQNNPGRRPFNEHEPQHEGIDTSCPPELTDPVAQAEWARVAPPLSARRQVTVVDRATLIGYCLKYGQWQALEIEGAKHAALVRGPGGSVMANPALRLANATFVLVLKAAAELGITPSSRSRVSTGPNLPDDAFDRFQQQRRKP
jgi:P27 family predicted phage terminase small subunit